MLLKENVNIDAVDETGKTALALAMDRGFEKAVEFLLTSGANVDLRQDHGRSIFLLIAERNWHKASDIIAEKAQLASEVFEGEERRFADFLLAVYHGDTLRAKSIAAIVIETKPRIAKMALLLAVERDNQTMVTHLLEHGIDVDSRDNAGKTPLHRATRRKNEDMMRLLIGRDAKVDARDDDGRTPWSDNLRLLDSRILGLLLQNGADPNTKGLQGLSELYTAGRNGEAALVKYMLDSGTNPSIASKYDWAPLHWAASYGYVECTRLLIEAGANLSPLSDQNVTPLDLAVEAKQSVTSEMLTQAGAKRGSDPTLEGARHQLEKNERVDEWTYNEDFNPNLSRPHEEAERAANEKLILVWDKPLQRTLQHPKLVGQFLYPSGSYTPRGYIYEISQVMELATHTLSVRKSRTRAWMRDYPLPASRFDTSDALYDIVRLRPDAQDFELRTRTQAQEHAGGVLRLHRDWTGGWKLKRWPAAGQGAPYYVVRVTPDFSKLDSDEESRWTSGTAAALLARTGWDDGTPNICFEPGVDRDTQDLMVVCWIAKLWSEFAGMTNGGGS